jgi:phospholipase A1
MNCNRINILIYSIFLIIPSLSFGLEPTSQSNLDNSSSAVTTIEDRNGKEERVFSNPFAITFHKQNYILPFYYTGSPYNKVYRDNTPNGAQLKKSEVKYQLSLKIPVWKNILGSMHSLHFAYTQLAYWQLYDKTAFFRETDYQPELFLTSEINWPLSSYLTFNTLNWGAVHESNGFGDQQERSWNRIYVEAILSTPTFMVSLKPWYVFHDATYNKFNPHMAKYLGYEELTLAYKLAKQVVTLQTHGLIERHGRYATGQVTYSFPITAYLNGFVQIFSGYGQSLIEYNHRTNSIGVGIALNNLI